MKNNLDQIAQDLTGQKEKNLVLFINALKQCLKKEPFEKVSVSDIVEAAGKSRQTFYRCCDNRYDLVNRYLGMIILKSYREIRKGFSLRDTLKLEFELKEPEKDLFAQTFKKNDYESLYRYTHRLLFAIFIDMNEKGRGVELTKEQVMLLDLYCEESIYATVKWSCREFDTTPQQMADLLIDAMPQKLKEVYREYLNN